MGAATRQSIKREDFADLLDEQPAPVVSVPVDAESLCEILIANLAAQEGLYAAYLDQANRQRMALVNRQLAENQDVNHESDLLLNSLAVLEEERMAVTAKILGPRLMGAASTPAKCEAIYPLVSAGKAARLKERRDALVAAVGELKHVLAINKSLVDNGSKIIHTTIAIMTSVAGRGKMEKMNTYTANGYVNVGKMQLRNLVNRSV
jgi:hypothetical protein